MKNNVSSKWTPEKINAMIAARGACKGHIAILASCEVGDEEMDAGSFSAVISVPETNLHDAISNLKARLHPHIGIYAILPSCEPETIMRAMKEVQAFSIDAFPPRSSHGIEFREGLLDGVLADIRQKAWDLLAEQWQVTILDAWGENPDA